MFVSAHSLPIMGIGMELVMAVGYDHYHLLTMPVSAKNWPPTSLLVASTNYLAL